MKRVTKLHKRSDVQFETADNLTKYNLNTLKKFSSIYIGGGNTWNLIHELRDSKFINILIKYIKAGGQIYGGSAGAIIMGKKINTHDNENKKCLRDTSGFNLLNNFSVACHFKDKQNNRFETWAIDNNLSIICLPEETGLVIEKGVALCAGAKPCVIYFANGTKKKINHGESFRL